MFVPRRSLKVLCMGALCGALHGCSLPCSGSTRGSLCLSYNMLAASVAVLVCAMQWSMLFFSSRRLCDSNALAKKWIYNYRKEQP